MKRVVSLMLNTVIGTGREAHAAAFAVRLARGGVNPMPALPEARVPGAARYDSRYKAGG